MGFFEVVRQSAFFVTHAQDRFRFVQQQVVGQVGLAFAGGTRSGAWRSVPQCIVARTLWSAARVCDGVWALRVGDLLSLWRGSVSREPRAGCMGTSERWRDDRVGVGQRGSEGQIQCASVCGAASVCGEQ